MAHAAIVIGAVTSAHFNRLIEFGIKPDNTGQNIHELFAIVAHPAVEFVHGPCPNPRAVGQHVFLGEGFSQQLMLVGRCRMGRPFAPPSNRHPSDDMVTLRRCATLRSLDFQRDR